jgi:hypothetical protein
VVAMVLLVPHPLVRWMCPAIREMRSLSLWNEAGQVGGEHGRSGMAQWRTCAVEEQPEGAETRGPRREVGKHVWQAQYVECAAKKVPIS